MHAETQRTHAAKCVAQQVNRNSMIASNNK